MTTVHAATPSGDFGVWITEGSLDRVTIPEAVVTDPELLNEQLLPLLTQCRNREITQLITHSATQDPDLATMLDFLHEALADAEVSADEATQVVGDPTTVESRDGSVTVHLLGREISRIDIHRTLSLSVRALSTALVEAVNAAWQAPVTAAEQELIGALGVADDDAELAAVKDRVVGQVDQVRTRSWMESS